MPSPAVRRRSLLDARLAIPDVMFDLVSSPDAPTDWVIYWVFNNETAGPPVASEVLAALHGRDWCLAALSRRAVDVPGNLGNPYWVTDQTPLARRLEVSQDLITWPDLLDTIVRNIVPGLDIHESTWRLTVHTDVRAVPTGAADPARTTGDGSATVVFAQFSHAIVFGRQIEAVSRALFGPDPEPLRVDGLGDPVARAQPIRAGLLGLSRLPFELARWRVLQRRAARAVRGAGGSPRPYTRAVPNLQPDSSRTAASTPAVRVVRSDLGAARDAGMTVTTLGTAAAALAVERYLAEMGQTCPPDPAALVWVALDEGPRLQGVNRNVSVQVDLCPAATNPVDRAQAIDMALRDARGPERNLDLHYQVSTALPFPIYRGLLRRSLRRTPNQQGEPRLDIAVSGAPRVASSADWSLAGRPYSFGCHVGRMPADYQHISPTIVGEPDDLTMTVTAFPTTVDIDRYVRALRAAFDDLTVAFAAAASAVLTSQVE